MAQSLRGGQEQVRGPLLVVRRGNIRIGDLDGEFDPVLGDNGICSVALLIHGLSSRKLRAFICVLDLFILLFLL